MATSRDLRVEGGATSAQERRLLLAAKRGDRRARDAVLRDYEPMVRTIVRRYFLPGGEREDLAQEARLGISNAIREWDPARRVPFRCFAWLCASRDVGVAVTSANAGKHLPLNTSVSLDLGIQRAADDHETGVQSRRAQVSAVAESDIETVVMLRERLAAIWSGMRELTALERRSIALAQAGFSEREIADALGAANPKVVNNALTRARRKLAQRAPHV